MPQLQPCVFSRDTYDFSASGIFIYFNSCPLKPAESLYGIITFINDIIKLFEM